MNDPTQSPDCVFCRIIAKEEPAEFVYDGMFAAVAFKPLNPVTEGHILVVPHEHAEILGDLSPSALAHTAEVVALLSKRVDECNIIQSNGAAATQTIKHVHFHIVPRREGDGLRLPWSES